MDTLIIALGNEGKLVDIFQLQSQPQLQLQSMTLTPKDACQSLVFEVEVVIEVKVKKCINRNFNFKA